MKSAYKVKAWQDDGWWLARVVGASEGADEAPLNALTQARTLTKVEPMARDLVATILDADEDDFEIAVEYTLPDEVSDLLSQTKAARAWLEAAQGLWQDRSSIAAHALIAKGYSLREAAVLLGLSHQRVDQLLGSTAERKFAASILDSSATDWPATWASTSSDLVYPMVVLVNMAAGHGEPRRPQVTAMDRWIREQLSKILLHLKARAAESGTTPTTVEEVLKHGCVIWQA